MAAAAAADEEQQMEIEALIAIFMDDFKIITDKPPRAYELSVWPSSDSAENHIGAQLAVTIPKLYPEVAPTIVVRSLKALTTVQRMTVQTMVDTMIAEQLGMTMMYNISEAVKEWMQDRNVKQLSMHEQMTERQKLAEIKAEAQELKKAEAVEKVSEQIRHGTPVTPAVFSEWNLRFLAERKERKEQAEREAEAAVDPDKASRQSGKRIFLEFQQTAALALAEAERLGQPASAAAAAGADVFFVDESLYADGDDLPEDGDDEEEVHEHERYVPEDDDSKE